MGVKCVCGLLQFVWTKHILKVFLSLLYTAYMYTYSTFHYASNVKIK